MKPYIILTLLSISILLKGQSHSHEDRWQVTEDFISGEIIPLFSDTLTTHTRTFSIDNTPLEVVIREIEQRDYIEVTTREDSTYRKLYGVTSTYTIEFTKAPPIRELMVPVHEEYVIDTIRDAEKPNRMLALDTVSAFPHTARFYWSGSLEQITKKLESLHRLIDDYPEAEYSLLYVYGNYVDTAVDFSPLSDIIAGFRRSVGSDKPNWFHLLVSPEPNSAYSYEIPILIELKE